MKKIALISSLVLMLLACSVSDVSNVLSPLFTPTPPPLATNTVYVTPSDTPTLTATLPTPTFTGTPTLVGGGFTETPTLTDTPTETPPPAKSTSNGTPSPDIEEGTPATPPGVGFTSVKISGNILRWGGCEPSSVTFTAHVTDPANETAVLLFYRLKSPTTGEETKMGGGALMDGDATGTFTYSLTVKNITDYQDFPGAWVQFQLVATNGGLEHLGQTKIYLNSLSISRCQ